MSVDRRSLLAGAAALAASGRAAGARRPGFLWGAATAAHQIEGQNVNSDYWVLEHIAELRARHRWA